MKINKEESEWDFNLFMGNKNSDMSVFSSNWFKIIDKQSSRMEEDKQKIKNFKEPDNTITWPFFII